MDDALERRTAGGTSYLTGGEGPAVVFLHGIPGSALTGSEVATRLQDEYRVVVPDLRGFGESDPPTCDYYMEGQARGIADLLAELADLRTALNEQAADLDEADYEALFHDL